MGGPLTSPRPAVLIIVDIESSRPRVTTTACNDEELARLFDWIAGQPNLYSLLQSAYALEAGAVCRFVDARGEDDEEP